MTHASTGQWHAHTWPGVCQCSLPTAWCRGAPGAGCLPPSHREFHTSPTPHVAPTPPHSTHDPHTPSLDAYMTHACTGQWHAHTWPGVCSLPNAWCHGGGVSHTLPSPSLDAYMTHACTGQWHAHTWPGVCSLPTAWCRGGGVSPALRLTP
jgi:hypothetical protein